MRRRRTYGARSPGSLRRDGSVPPAELSEDADVVRATYLAVKDGDLEALAETVSPDVGWIDPLVSRLPFDGTRRGIPSLLRAAFRRDRDGNGPRLSPETFVEMGDGVLVAGRFLDGAKEEPFLHECLVGAGKVYLVRGYPAAP